MEVTPEQLDELRALLMIGWFATCALLAIVNWDIISGAAAKQPPKLVEFCKLHSRPLTECIAQHKEPPE